MTPAAEFCSAGPTGQPVCAVHRSSGGKLRLRHHRQDGQGRGEAAASSLLGIVHVHLLQQARIKLCKQEEMQDSSPGHLRSWSINCGRCFLLDLPFGAVVLEQRQTDWEQKD